VEFRTVDGAGNVSSWSSSAATAANTVRLDRTAPTDPVVTGGSLTCAASRTLSGSGSTDAGGSGFAHYQHRISADNGVTWDVAVTGASLTLNTSGTYLIQFRAVDGAGNTSAWAPASPGPTATACIS
jgi:hypothetical protein